jgi:hypothetical protein
MTTTPGPQSHDYRLQFFAYAHLPQQLQDISNREPALLMTAQEHPCSIRRPRP